MIIAIDTVMLQKRYENTGTYNYAIQLLNQCLRILETTTGDMEFHGFGIPQNSSTLNEVVSPLFHLHETRMLNPKNVWRLGGMAISTSKVQPDLVFLPTALGAIPGPFTPVVATIHDAMAMRLPPELMVGSRRMHFLTWVATKLASRVITISNWSKQDLVEIYGLNPEKIGVSYLGYDRQHYNSTLPDPEESTTFLARFGIHKPFVLHHGTVELRKNLHRLIQAWDRMMEQGKDFDTQLVLAGSKGHGYEEILRIRNASPYRDQIILPGVLPDAELAMLIKNATLCVVPSLYEGFCLPMLEAMACGVPTVASNSSCIPEISGGVLEYFDPLSVEEMADVIRRALGDSSLRDRLRHGGLVRATEFSWERCARETLDIFRATVAEIGSNLHTSPTS